MSSLHEATIRLVKEALKEDIGFGDLTSLACLEPNPFKGKIVAKSDGILSGKFPTLVAFEIVDSANIIDFKINDGDSFKSGDLIVEIDGFNQTVLTSERTALNFLGHLSGVATLTNKFVKLIGDNQCRIVDTRKTTPGWRLIEKQAVVHGKGENHRLGLFDMILIKDNHIASSGNITSAVNLAKEYIQTSDFRLQFNLDANEIVIEVEVTNENQLTEAINAGAHRLLLDNQTIDQLLNLVSIARKINPLVKLEASGNVSLETVAKIASTGVDYISVGALTHSAPNSDFSLQAVE